MPNLTFKNPEGQKITVNSPDGSTPSESELDQLFAKAHPPSDSDSLYQKQMAASNKIISDNSGQQAVESTPRTQITDPNFLPELSKEAYRGLVSSGEGMTNIAQGLINIATMPFKPLGLDATKALSPISSALQGVEQSIPETNLPNFVKIGSQLAGSLATGIGEYGLASKAIGTLGEATTAGKIMAGTAKVMSNPIIGDEQKAAAMINMSTGLKNLPITDKVLAGVLNNKVLSEGSKMALLGGLESYGQTDDAKKALQGAATGGLVGLAFGAGGELYDHAAELLKNNGEGITRKFLQMTLGNPEIQVNGKTVKVIDDFINNPDKYNLKQPADAETPIEYKARMATEISDMSRKQDAEITDMKNAFATTHSEKQIEFKDLVHKLKEERDNLSKLHEGVIAGSEKVKSDSMFGAREQNVFEKDANAIERKSAIQDSINTINKHIDSMRNLLQSQVENVAVEAKSMAEKTRTDLGESVDKAIQNLPANTSVPVNSFRQKIAIALNKATSYGERLIGNMDRSTIQTSKGNLTREQLDNLIKIGQVNGSSEQAIYRDLKLSKNDADKFLSANDSSYAIKSNFPGGSHAQEVSQIQNIVNDLVTSAKDNGRNIPVGKLALAKKDIFNKLNAANATGSPMGDVYHALYEAINPASYADVVPALKPVAEANAAFHGKANQFDAIHKILFTGDKINIDTLVKEYTAGDGPTIRRLEKAEQGLDNNLKISKKVKDVVENSANMVTESNKSIATISKNLDKELLDYRLNQSRKIYELGKAYDAKLEELNIARNKAIESKNYQNAQELSKQRADLDTWKNETLKSIKDKTAEFTNTVEQAKQAAKEQHDHLNAQQMLSSWRTNKQGLVRYFQNYSLLHGIFKVASNPVGAAVNMVGAGLVSPKLISGAYKAARGMPNIPVASKSLSILNKLLRNEKIRQGAVTYTTNQQLKKK